MPLAKVYITLKKGVLDPQGLAVKNALESMGYSGVTSVRVGKFMEINLENTHSPQEVEDKLTRMCDRLLTNPVIEDYHFEIEEVG